MSNTHKSINEEVEVTIKLKVKFTGASFYGERTAEELVAEIAQAKENMKNRILEMVEDEYVGQEDLSDGKKGYVNFDYEIERAEEVPVINPN